MNRPLWWDVPMSPAVAKLPRTASGMPVVYVTDYNTNGEDDDIFTPITPRVALKDCTCKFGVGRPMIGKLCPRRQAQGMLQARCGVCGIKLNAGKEMVWVGTVLVELDGGIMVRSQEPPVHPDCATYSLLTCPRLYHNLDRTIVTISRNYGIRAKMTPLGATEPKLYSIKQLNQTTGAVDMYIALIPHAASREMPARLWLDQARPLDRPSLKAVMPQRKTGT